jgi:hypothetical protein
MGPTEIKAFRQEDDLTLGGTGISDHCFGAFKIPLWLTAFDKQLAHPNLNHSDRS